MRILIYMRTSTKAQAKLATIESQRLQLPAIARLAGHEVVETVEDDGLSGRLLADRALDGVLNRIEGGELDIEALLVAEQSRVIRADPDDLDSLQDAMRIRFLFRKHRIKVIEASGAINDYSADSLGTDIREAVSSHEWQTLRRRSIAGKRVAAKAGKSTGTVPYGLKFVRGEDRREGTWQLDNEEAKTVRRIFRMYADDRTGSSGIARTLNLEAIPSGRGKPKWSPQHVLRILENESYVGRRTLRVGDESIVVTVPVTVDEPLWLRAKSVREDRGNRRAKKKTVWALLSGAATCGHCGKAVVGTSSVNRGIRRARYTCASTTRNYTRGTPQCGLGTFYASIIDEEVWDKICTLLADPSALAVAANLAEEAQDVSSVAAEIAALERSMAKLERSVQDTLRHERRGVITESQSEEALRDINAERGVVARTLEIAKARLSSGVEADAIAQSLATTAEKLSAAVHGADAKLRNEIVKALCPTRQFGFVITRRGKKELDVRGHLCLELADGGRVSVEVG